MSELAEALRDSDDIKKERNETQKENKDLRERLENVEKTLRMKSQLHRSANGHSHRFVYVFLFTNFVLTNFFVYILLFVYLQIYGLHREREILGFDEFLVSRREMEDEKREIEKLIFFIFCLFLAKFW